jgi:phage anti-repressor protein
MDSLQNYLKKFSTIDDDFIDDFFSLYKYNTKENEFVINLESLVKWLGAIKGSLKETLINSYVKDVDYKVEAIKHGNNGRPAETIMLTPDCMKHLCMLSRTKKAKKVREYFVELEKHIDQYKDVIIERYMSNHTPQQVETKGGVIYLLNTDLNLPGIYKIGKTTDFKARLKTHQSSTVDNIKVVKVYKTEDIDNVEKCLKQYLKEKQYKKYKEFYQVDKEIVSKLFKVCNKTTLAARNILHLCTFKTPFYTTF